MKICHTSDLHGFNRSLPWADLYVVTGDIFPNFPTLVFHPKSLSSEVFYYRPNDHLALGHHDYEFRMLPRGNYVGSQIDRGREQHLQALWTERVLKLGPWLELGNTEAPIVCVRGNHDFVRLSPLLSTSTKGPVYEYDGPTDRFPDLCGLKICGFRGINYINGRWSDEMHDSDLQKLVDELPDDFDLLITHTPPAGILDYVDYDREHIGAKPLAAKLNRLMMQGKKFIHCFGHNHEEGGVVKEIDGCTFSNAATTANRIGDYSMFEGG